MNIYDYFTKEDIPALRAVYEKAVNEGRSELVFNGSIHVTEFIKYVLEFYDQGLWDEN